MVSLRILTIFAVVGLAAGFGCPNVKTLTKEELDLQKYAGTWYEVASQNLGFLSSCSCSRYQYKMTGESTFDDRFSCTKAGKADGIDLTLKGKIADPVNDPAKQVESPVFSWAPTAPYWIMEVGKDYEYAVVYSCVSIAGEYIYIFHRDPTALTKGLIDLDGIRGRLKAQGIDESQIKVVPQPETCSYPSEASLVV